MERHLPPPQTVNDFYAAALLDALDALHGLLSDRLPAPTAAGPVAAEEPTPEPDRQPVEVKEPAPSRAPRRTTKTNTSRKAD